jgi:serine/threonine-protein kinase SRPK3
MKVAGTLTKPKPETVAAPSTEGLTKQQKKNLKKKLARKRKKLEQSVATSTIGGESNADDTEANLNEVNVNTEQVLAQGQEFAQKKKKAITDSLDRLGAPQPELDNLLGEDLSKEKNAAEKPETSKRGPRINEDVQVKICDMGNGCWTYHHFTPEIQTRQYRSPEVIIGADYNTSADVWSFACTIFEMITGDFLFEPRKGQNYDKDDDHLAQMMELLGRMPKNLALSGKHSRKFFDSRGNLRRISGLNYWPLRKVLTDKYLIKEKEALALSDFLMPMLSWYHDRRATA